MAGLVPAINVLSALRLRNAHLPRLIPASKTSTILPSALSAKGRFARRYVEAGRGCGACGPNVQVRHSGDAGAPPGTNKSPCQELADDLGFAP